MRSRKYIASLAGEPPEYMIRPEAATYCRISMAFLADRTAAREIPSLKVGFRRLYRRADLDAWMASKLDNGDVAGGDRDAHG